MFTSEQSGQRQRQPVPTSTSDGHEVNNLLVQPCQSISTLAKNNLRKEGDSGPNTASNELSPNSQNLLDDPPPSYEKCFKPKNS